jgi:hypothetical protein
MSVVPRSCPIRATASEIELPLVFPDLKIVFALQEQRRLIVECALPPPDPHLVKTSEEIEGGRNHRSEFSEQKAPV